MWAALVLHVGVTAARAQEPSPSPPPSRPITPLKVQVVLSKYQGDQKIASLPYTLTCSANDRNSAKLRMGVELPVSVFQPKEGGTSFQYKNVGTAIDCRATTVEGGRFRLELDVEHSSIYSTVDEKARRSASPEGPPALGVTDTSLANIPMFRSFKSTFVPIVRDGQTAQYTVATDPVIGEVVKIDVTVTVLK